MLTASQIAAAMTVSLGRVYRARSKSFSLLFALAPARRKGGATSRMYSISVILPRIKHALYPTPKQIKKVFELGGYNV